MVHLAALCHRSSRLVSQRPRKLLTTKRSFFSFFGSNDNHSSSSRLTEEETAAQVKQQEEATRVLLDGVYHRISIQHAHPLGPWQAILAAVQDHYDSWVDVQDAIKLKKEDNAAEEIARTHEELGIASTILPAAAVAAAPFRVLDLASGPRGEPGTTIAHALPLAAVHCTDSCSVAVAAIPVHILVDEAISKTAAVTDVGIGGLSKKNSILSAIAGDDATIQAVAPLSSSSNLLPLLPPPPKNLTKSIADLTDLSSYSSNSFDAIICCYGYNLSSNVPHALAEAYRVLVPGGVLVIATWERSAMLAIGRDVEAYVRGGGRDPYSTMDDDESFLPPRIVPVNKIELSGVGELEALLIASGFDQPQAVLAKSMVYPIDLGNNSDDQFAMGTILVRDELESLGALGSPATDGGNGAWGNLAEEAFWMNIQKYADVVEGNLLLRDNTYKLTVSAKK
mmetsp:Transcript_18363/g.31073  ORF Transcript_18363/g.31073 Transcript_18363/m.31073 type:complete len:452 (-) Transcript_18363:131-1486(-)